MNKGWRALVPVLLLAQGPSLAAAPAESGRPRRTIVLVVFDTTRRDEFGAYGGNRNVTPAADQLARTGLVYTAAFAPDSFTVPSHGALFTGQMVGTESSLPAEVETLPEAIKRAGFKTVGVSANWLLSPENGFSRGFDFFTNVVDSETRQALDEKRERPAEDRRQAATAQATIATLAKAIKEQVGPEDSLFIFLNFFDPHDPYTPNQPFRDRFARGAVVSGHLRDREGGLEGFFDRALRLSRRERRDLRRLYRAEVAQADAGLASLQSLLTSLERGPETLFVVTADHGELLGERGAWTHNVGLSEEEIHVHLIVSGPGVARGAVASPVGLADVKEALVDWANGKEWAIRSNAGAMAFHHVYPGNERTSDPLIKTDALSVAEGDWRMVRSGGGCRLFRRAEPYWAEFPCDPSAGLGAVFTDLLNERTRTRVGVKRLRSWIEGKPSAEWILKLRSLGYIGH
jgi:arylsulfatase A-like enzyme